MKELLKGKDISITTFREGRADTGHRREIKGLGFAEAELVNRIWVSHQRFILPKEDNSSNQKKRQCHPVS